MNLLYSSNLYSTDSIFKSLLLITSILTLSACTSIRSPTPPQTSTDIADSARSDLKLCKMKVSNPPANLASSKACIRGIELFVAPAPKACLSSGYGFRGGRRHSGIDFQSKPAGTVVAAGDGKIIAITFRLKDYGRWIIIDHGNGIYTSYAHLKNVEPNLVIGSSVRQGQRLGIMGKTGAAAKAIHLHFELREGDYANPKSWWGLNPLDPFSQADTCS